MSSLEEEMKGLEEAFGFGGFISFFLSIFIGCMLNKMCPRYKWDQCPPGPAELKGVGNVHQIARGNSTLEKIQKWRSIYGDVVGLSMSQYRMVILSGYETIREAFHTPEFSKVLMIKPFHTLKAPGEQKYLGFALPKDQQVVLRLKNFSVRNISEAILVQQNITELEVALKEKLGQPWIPHTMITESVIKSLSSVIFGRMLSLDDIQYQVILASVFNINASSNVHSGPSFFVATIFPSIANSVEKVKSAIMGASHEEIDPLQDNLNRDTILDAFFTDINKIRCTSEAQSVGDILALVAATCESTSNTLIWALYYLTKHPKIQEQVYDEVYTVFGKKRGPSLDDINLCPITLAVIDEVLRITSLSPLGYIYTASEDVMFQGHFIPKDSLVCNNSYAHHTDKKIWGDPQTFRPDRFILRNPATGQLEKDPNAPSILPFSVSRQTLGEFVTKNLVFLYLTSLVQKFQTSCSSEDLQLADIEPGSELQRAPKKFQLIIRERF